MRESCILSNFSFIKYDNLICFSIGVKSCKRMISMFALLKDISQRLLNGLFCCGIACWKSLVHVSIWDGSLKIALVKQSVAVALLRESIPPSPHSGVSYPSGSFCMKSDAGTRHFRSFQNPSSICASGFPYRIFSCNEPK